MEFPHRLAKIMVLAKLVVLSACVTDSFASFPDISGLASAGRYLGEVVTHGISPDMKSVGRFLTVLNDTKISEGITDAMVKGSLSALSNEAKSAQDHLHQLDQLLDEIGESIKKAKYDTDMSSGPKTEDLINAKERCRVVEVLRTSQKNFNDAVNSLEALPGIINEVKNRAELIADFEHQLEDALLEIQKDPSLIGVTYAILETNIFFDPWLTALENEKKSINLSEKATTIYNDAFLLLGLLRVKKENFDGNMKTFIEPMAATYCNAEEEKSDFENYEKMAVEKAPLLTKRPSSDQDCLDFDASWSNVILEVKGDNSKSVWEGKGMATSWDNFQEIMTGIEQRLMARQKEAVDYCYSLVPKKKEMSGSGGSAGGVSLDDIEKEFLDKEKGEQGKEKNGDLLAKVSKASSSYDDERRKSSKAAMDIVGQNADGVHLDKDCNFDPNEVRRFFKSLAMKSQPVEPLDQVIARGKGMGYNIGTMISLNYGQVAECKRAINERRSAGSNEGVDVLEDCVFVNNFYARALECRQDLEMNQGGK